MLNLDSSRPVAVFVTKVEASESPPLSALTASELLGDNLSFLEMDSLGLSIPSSPSKPTFTVYKSSDAFSPELKLSSSHWYERTF